MAKPKILIVEDEWIIANDLKAGLTNLGYIVSSIASTGREAIEFIKTKKIDLVLMDIVLQGEMDGIETAREIISGFDIPVIYLTAYTDEDILKQAKKSGAYGYLVKPFKDRDMQATIELALYKHEMEKKLKASEARLYTTLISINDAVISTDDMGLIIFMNPLAESLTGWKLEDAGKKSLADIFNINRDEQEKEAENPVIKIIREGLTITQANYILNPHKGPKKSIELSSAPIKNEKGNINGVVIVFRDITRRIQTEKELEEYRKQLERKKTEDALRESETKFRTLFNQASDSIFLLSFSPDGLIIADTNDAASMMHGYSREEMIGEPISFLDDTDTANRAKERTGRLQKGEKLSFEGRHVRKDGSTFPVDVSTQLVYIAESPYVLAIDRDITERKQIEEKLLKHQEHLEELVKERARELLEANKNLKVEVNVRKLAEKKLLEYQKQLQLLTSQLSLIEENEKRRIATELHDCIGQTLALSKIKLGLLNKSAPSEELRKGIKEILHLIEQTIKETRTLTFELSPPILYELGLSQAIKWLIDQFREKHGLDIELTDDGRDKPFNNNTRFFLFQAIRELLVNVVKHSQATRANIIMTRDDGNLRIILEDNGIGFSTPSVNHDGYGLFNIRERMNHINGQFEIESVPGRGTRVTLVAPLMFENKLIKRS